MAREGEQAAGGNGGGHNGTAIGANAFSADRRFPTMQAQARAQVQGEQWARTSVPEETAG